MTLLWLLLRFHLLRLWRACRIHFLWLLYQRLMLTYILLPVCKSVLTTALQLVISHLTLVLVILDNCAWWQKLSAHFWWLRRIWWLTMVGTVCGSPCTLLVWVLLDFLSLTLDLVASKCALYMPWNNCTKFIFLWVFFPVLWNWQPDMRTDSLNLPFKCIITSLFLYPLLLGALRVRIVCLWVNPALLTREMADRPTEPRYYGAHNTAPPLSKLPAYTGVSLGMALWSTGLI